MRCILTADVHLRDGFIMRRERWPICRQFMEDLLVLAEWHNVRHVFILGDLLDRKHNPPIEILIWLKGFFRKASHAKGVTFHWIRGNHETPEKSAPEKTIMRLFGDGVDVIYKPQVVSFPDTVFYCIPWYPAGTYIKAVKAFAALANNERARRRILLTHQGLKEGRLDTGRTIQQPVGVKHLYPSLFHSVLLGDYHTHQQVGVRDVYYLGAPMPHRRGENGCLGPWLVDTAKMAMEPLVLPHPVPAFRKWTLSGDPRNVPIPGYNSFDYNDVYCPAEFMEYARLIYPGANILDSGEVHGKRDLDLSSSRARRSDVKDPKKLLGRWFDLKGIPNEEKPELEALGLSLLEEAERVRKVS